jgi:hypothetical protein
MLMGSSTSGSAVKVMPPSVLRKSWPTPTGDPEPSSPAVIHRWLVTGDLRCAVVLPEAVVLGRGEG